MSDFEVEHFRASEPSHALMIMRAIMCYEPILDNRVPFADEVVEYYDGLVNTDGEIFLVRQAGLVVATATFMNSTVDTDNIQLFGFAVREEYRGRRIGSAVFEARLHGLANREWAHLRAEPLEASKPIFERAGFNVEPEDGVCRGNKVEISHHDFDRLYEDLFTD